MTKCKPIIDVAEMASTIIESSIAGSELENYIRVFISARIQANLGQLESLALDDEQDQKRLLDRLLG